MTFLDRFRPHFYAVLRIVTGFLFFWHGSQKLFGFPPSSMETPAVVTYVAGPIELVGGLMLIAGFLVRPVAFLCSGLMAAAYWIAHGTKAPLPIQNAGELSMLYCFLFLYIAAEGAGIWSVDGPRDGGA